MNPIVGLVLLATVAATACHHFGVDGLGILAAVWLVMPFHPRS